MVDDAAGVRPPMKPVVAKPKERKIRLNQTYLHLSFDSLENMEKFEEGICLFPFSSYYFPFNHHGLRVSTEFVALHGNFISADAGSSFKRRGTKSSGKRNRYEPSIYQRPDQDPHKIIEITILYV